jgi:hypothetical protein
MPTHLDDRSPGSLVVSAEVRRITHGTCVDLASKTVEDDYPLYVHEPHPSAKVPPGFAEAHANNSWLVFEQVTASSGAPLWALRSPLFSPSQRIVLLVLDRFEGVASAHEWRELGDSEVDLAVVRAVDQALLDQ